MNSEDLAKALAIARPGAEWVLRGETFGGLEWLDPVQAAPTFSELTTALASFVPTPTVEDQIAALQTQVSDLQVQTSTILTAKTSA